MDTKHNDQNACADGATGTAYGHIHSTPTRPTPSYLRDYHNDDKQT